MAHLDHVSIALGGFTSNTSFNRKLFVISDDVVDVGDSEMPEGAACGTTIPGRNAFLFMVKGEAGTVMFTLKDDTQDIAEQVESPTDAIDASVSTDAIDASVSSDTSASTSGHVYTDSDSPEVPEVPVTDTSDLQELAASMEEELAQGLARFEYEYIQNHN